MRREDEPMDGDTPAQDQATGGRTARDGDPAGRPATGGGQLPPRAARAARWRLPSWPRRTVLSLVAGIVVAAGVAYVLASGQGSSPARSSSPATVASGPAPAPGITTADARLLSLDVFPKGQRDAAPTFQLTDRNGQPTSLRQFRGKVVVWSLNDDECLNMCRLYAQDVVAAEHDLGPAARHVVFLAVNANPYHTAPATVEAWSVKNDVAQFSNWVYVTGTPAQLKATWNAYHATVVPTPKSRTVNHDAISYFIDPSGRMRAISEFTNGSISTGYYAHAMAQMADDLLPKSEQVHVGGLPIAAPATSGASIGDQAPGFRLRTLRSGAPVSLTSLGGKPLVLNFWSSTCSICDREMPGLQAVASAFGSKIRVVGVDVADPRTSAAAFAATVGAHYQLLSDQQGSTAAAYRVSALPVTFLISASGTIVARHPGALTAAELSFILADDFHGLPAPTLATAP